MTHRISVVVLVVLGYAACPALSLQKLSPSRTYLDSLSTVPNRWDYGNRILHFQQVSQTGTRQRSALKMTEDNAREPQNKARAQWTGSSLRQPSALRMIEDKKMESYREYMRTILEFKNESGAAVGDVKTDVLTSGATTPSSTQTRRDPTAEAMAEFFRRSQKETSMQRDPQDASLPRPPAIPRAPPMQAGPGRPSAGGFQQEDSYMDFAQARTPPGSSSNDPFENTGVSPLQEEIPARRQTSFESQLDTQYKEGLRQGVFKQEPDFAISEETDFAVSEETGFAVSEETGFAVSEESTHYAAAKQQIFDSDFDISTEVDAQSNNAAKQEIFEKESRFDVSRQTPINNDVTGGKASGDGAMDAYLAAMSAATPASPSFTGPKETVAEKPMSRPAQSYSSGNGGSYLDALSSQVPRNAEPVINQAFDAPKGASNPQAATGSYAPKSKSAESSPEGIVTDKNLEVSSNGNAGSGSGGSYMDALSSKVVGNSGSGASYMDALSSEVVRNIEPANQASTGSYAPKSKSAESSPEGIVTDKNLEVSSNGNAGSGSGGSYMDALSSKVVGNSGSGGSYLDALSSQVARNIEPANQAVDAGVSSPQDVPGSYLNALSTQQSNQANSHQTTSNQGIGADASYFDTLSSQGVRNAEPANQAFDANQRVAASDLNAVSSWESKNVESFPKGVASETNLDGTRNKNNASEKGGSYLDALSSQIAQSTKPITPSEQTVSSNRAVLVSDESKNAESRSKGVASESAWDTSADNAVSRAPDDPPLHFFLKEKTQAEKSRNVVTPEEYSPALSKIFMEGVRKLMAGPPKNEEAEKSILSSITSFFNDALEDKSSLFDMFKNLDLVDVLKGFDMTKYFPASVIEPLEETYKTPETARTQEEPISSVVEKTDMFKNLDLVDVLKGFDMTKYFPASVIEPLEETYKTPETTETARTQEEPISSVVEKTAKDVIEQAKRAGSSPFFATTTTYRIMTKLDEKNQNVGSGGDSRTYEAFQKLDSKWTDLKQSRAFKYTKSKRLTRAHNGIPPPTPFVSDDGGVGKTESWVKLIEQRDMGVDFDVVVCGGTLGIFYAAALQARGLNTCVLTPSDLRGSEQEWNVSMEDLMELEKLGVLTRDDIDAAITTRYPGCRSGFKTREISPIRGGFRENGVGYECVTDEVLTLGVTPALLLERVTSRFKELGGTIKEKVSLGGVAVSEFVGAAVDIGDTEPVTASLVLDCLGNDSPVARQQRYGTKPDGVCAVVGSCAGGFDPDRNVLGDIIYSNSEIQEIDSSMQQVFWESFPVNTDMNDKNSDQKQQPIWDPFKGATFRKMLSKSSDVKTTYMFAYMDPDRRSPSLESLYEEYWQMLPKYQPPIEDPETDLDIKRLLFAYFPTYKEAPLKPQWSRVLSIGDASGTQNPLGFGGFRSLSREIGRITDAVTEAVELGCLHKDDLSEITAYAPNLSALWMFQKAMSVRAGQRPDPRFVNRLLSTAFQGMNENGSVKPFLKGVVRFDAMMAGVAKSVVSDPLFMREIVDHVGAATLGDWIGHVGNMAWYGFLDENVAPVMERLVDRASDPRVKFQWNRRMEAWKYGSGNDGKKSKPLDNFLHDMGL